MSRGFVREDDQEEAPFVPPRAILPAGIDNYVTPEGLRLLESERDGLIEARKATAKLSDRDRRRETAVIDVQIAQVNERIEGARVIEPDRDHRDVRFGKQVTFRPISPAGPSRTFRIVGVDEANIREAKVAFIAPIVRRMIGLKRGEQFTFQQGKTSTQFEVIEIMD
jgi:transcription elongation factor GreB